MVPMFKGTMDAHDELRKVLGPYWPDTMATTFPPPIVKAFLGCVAVGLCGLVALVMGFGHSVSTSIGVVLLILLAAAFIQHLGYYSAINGAWERFRHADPAAYAIAQKRYWGLP